MSSTWFKLLVIYFLSLISSNHCGGNKLRLTLISPEMSSPSLMNGFVDIKAKSTLKLRCEGDRAIEWKFPKNHSVKNAFSNSFKHLFLFHVIFRGIPSLQLIDPI